MRFDIASLDIDSVVDNSYRNFHSKGLDYICIKRDLELTVKLYFFDGDVSKLPEVVNPHDHRYDFRTTCIAGEVENIWYQAEDGGDTFQAFDYLTPLNGGDGFTWSKEIQLGVSDRRAYRAGRSYRMEAADLHTIRMRAPETVLLLEQYADVVPVGEPTQTFCLDAEPPSLDGLYDRFTADEIVRKLLRLNHKLAQAGAV